MNMFKNKKTNVIYKKNSFTEDKFIIGKDETLDPKFTRLFGISYSVNVYYINICKPELFLENNSISIHLPMAFKNQNNQKLLNIILYKMYKKIAENELDNIMEKARHTFGFAPEDYEIKKLNDTLASCDKDLQYIAINPYLMSYSKDIIEYVIFHEFCHLKYKTHSKKFYEMLKKYKSNYELIAKKIPNLKY